MNMYHPTMLIITHMQVTFTMLQWKQTLKSTFRSRSTIRSDFLFVPLPHVMLPTHSKTFTRSNLWQFDYCCWPTENKQTKTKHSLPGGKSDLLQVKCVQTRRRRHCILLADSCEHSSNKRMQQPTGMQQQQLTPVSAIIQTTLMIASCDKYYFITI